MVSELVTNGIVHSGPRKGTITLDLRINDGVHCAVCDRGPGFTRLTEVGDAPSWGLSLVERLACRWGLTRSQKGTEVWFETGGR